MKNRIEESSLGTATAGKNQTETPIEAYRRVQDHLRGSESAYRQGDVDDFLFHLVTAGGELAPDTVS
jgi:hypothetical protein